MFMVFIEAFLRQSQNSSSILTLIGFNGWFTHNLCVCVDWFYCKKRFYNTLHQESFVPIYIYFFMPILMVSLHISKPLNIELILIPTYLLMLLYTVISFLVKPTVFNPVQNCSHRNHYWHHLEIQGTWGYHPSLAILWHRFRLFRRHNHLVNAIFVMTIGAYTYSRGTESVKASIKNVLTSIINGCHSTSVYCSMETHQAASAMFSETEKLLLMWALWIQLVIFGMFLATVSWRVFYPRIASIVLGSKFILLPLIALITIRLFDIKTFYAQLILLQTLVPYCCK